MLQNCRFFAYIDYFLLCLCIFLQFYKNFGKTKNATHFSDLQKQNPEIGLSFCRNRTYFFCKSSNFAAS